MAGDPRQIRRVEYLVRPGGGKRGFQSWPGDVHHIDGRDEPGYVNRGGCGKMGELRQQGRQNISGDITLVSRILARFIPS